MADPDPTHKLISKRDAISQRLPRYFTGKPCKRGHIAERFRSGGQCVVCNNELARASKRNPDYKAHNAAYNAAWWKANLDKARGYAKKRWNENPQNIRDASNRWKKRNPDKQRVLNQKRRTRKRANGGSFTVEDIARIFRLQRGKCAYCRCKLTDYDIDHIQPVSRGGSSNPSNLCLACRPCNRAKRDKDPITWAQQRGLLL